MANLSDFVQGIEQLIELAQKLDEKKQSGELRTEVRIQARPLGSSIPPSGSIPRRRSHAQTGDPPWSSEPRVVSATRFQEPFQAAVPDSPSTAADRVESWAGPRLKDVGGLREQLQILREMVELPLKRPDLLAKLGLDPPRGVLLVGAPGTGKTLTARALAESLGVNYIAVVGPELIGKYYGEAEARLRQLFEKAAKSAPCLVFIDEIDALVPNRATVEGEVEKRLVAQMLGLMDGFVAQKGIVVLAATNRPEALDPALRRPGRFDREVIFKVPDREGRREILAIHTRDMPLAEDVDLDSLADQTLGFVGADLRGLCQAAAYAALRRQVPDLGSPIPDSLTVSAADFQQALQQVKPAVLRSVEIESPQVSWDQIGGLDDAKQILQEAIEGSLLHPELYEQAQAQAPKGILLSGPPGTGKTLLAKAIASQAKANFIAVSGPELLSKWVGSSEQAVRELFARARQCAPCVIFIDEIDTLAPARGSYSGDSGVSDRVLGQLLAELDGIRPSQGVLVVAATNRKASLDPALTRAGRLELHLSVELPNCSGRREILAVHNRKRPLGPDVDLQGWAEQTEGWSGADLALLSNRAAIAAIRRHRSTSGGVDAKTLVIQQEDFCRAFAELQQQRQAG
ncbi:MAG TPA: AAA family ATPase [Synechococcus sp. M44_DOE_062]|nr:AAA family ATPase [Synechococcus sp. M44_DOE_062]